jgi:hypothetical protein
MSSLVEAKAMSLLTVEGIYRDGKVELTERPDRVVELARVLVTFLPPAGGPETMTPSDDEEREVLRQRAFARMTEGIHLGGPPYPAREKLHDRSDR